MKTRRHHRIVFVFVILALAALPSCSKEIGQGDTAWNDWIAPYRHDVDMGGYKMHYIDAGRGEPVILVHGYGGSTYCWSNNIQPLLDAGFRVIAVDQPGMGRSDLPPEPYQYSLENQADAVLALADKLGIDQFRLAGHSQGGGIALYLAMRHPARVTRAVAIDPACYEPSRPGKFLVKIPGAETIYSWFGGRYATTKALNQIFVDDALVTQAMIDEYTRPHNKPGYAKALLGLSRSYFSDKHRQMAESYGSIQVPALILWGKEDPWLPVEYGHQLHKEMDGSQLHVIDQAGHNPHQEKPGEVNERMGRFFRPGA